MAWQAIVLLYENQAYKPLWYEVKQLSIKNLLSV